MSHQGTMGLLRLVLLGLIALASCSRIVIEHPVNGFESLDDFVFVQFSSTVASLPDTDDYDAYFLLDKNPIRIGRDLFDTGTVEMHGIGMGGHRIRMLAVNRRTRREISSNEIVFWRVSSLSDDALAESDPSQWLVYGDILQGGVMGDQGELFLQPRDSLGNNITAREEVASLRVEVEPFPVEQWMALEETGRVHLTLRWRQVGITTISVMIGQNVHLASSPYEVFVGEKYEVKAVTSGAAQSEQADEGTSRGGSCQRYAYVTILTNDAFCKGVLVLHYTLRLTNTSRPLICLTTREVSQGCRELISSVGMRIVDVRAIANPNANHKQHFRHVYSKLHVFGLIEFDKVVYLDADMLVLRNIDHLFQYPSLSAAPEINPPALFNSGTAGFFVVVLVSFTGCIRSHGPQAFPCAFSQAHAACSAHSFLRQDRSRAPERVLCRWMGGRWHMLPYTYNFLKVCHRPSLPLPSCCLPPSGSASLRPGSPEFPRLSPSSVYLTLFVSIPQFHVCANRIEALYLIDSTVLCRGTCPRFGEEAVDAL
eukprot:360423-Hanusia_phi.AAC.1